MIRLLDAIISALYAVADAAVWAACALGGPRNRIAVRRWEASGALHDREPF